MTIEYATHYRQASRIPAEVGKPYFVEKGEGDRAHLFGDLITIYAGGEQTENTFNFFTVEGPKGDLAATHPAGLSDRSYPAGGEDVEGVSRLCSLGSGHPDSERVRLLLLLLLRVVGCAMIAE